ncbi:MAG: hypothetical protein GY773_21940, partial [Actinomycetia bacterium]|nr:hypothetical protein [Actinomycetes bacterium]
MGLWLGVLIGCGTPKEANQSPVFSNLPSEAQLQAGDALELTVAASDPDGDTVRLSIEEGPPGAEFIASEQVGRFFWAPLASDASPNPYEIIFSATDGRGGRTTARILVTVEAADSAPRVVSALRRVLDLGQQQTLNAELVVKDDDSTQVEMYLEDEPTGMELNQFEPKSAELSWTPEPDQINTQSVWTATLVIDDRDSGPVRETISVILIPKGKEDECTDDCGCNPPDIRHKELGDQRGAGDYVVSATITDDQSEI